MSQEWKSSFSSGVKEELTRITGRFRHCRLAELAAILSLFAHSKVTPYGFALESESPYAVFKVYQLMKQLYGAVGQTRFCIGMNGSKICQYEVCYPDAALTDKVFEDTGLLRRAYEPSSGKARAGLLVPDALLEKACCRKAYIRGAFLACGSMNDPSKNYHLEFLVSRRKSAERIQSILREYAIECRILERVRSKKKNGRRMYVVYLKNGDQLSDVLSVMGADTSMLDLENIRVEKDMKNHVQRQVNCETANLSKTVSSAVRETSAILYIKEKGAFSSLPDELKEAAKARLKYPEATLQEIGQMMDPPVSKSGANHRLKKIMALADDLKSREETALPGGTE